MDFDNIWYIIGLVIYLIYSANQGLKKAKESRERERDPHKPVTPKKSWEEEMAETWRKAMGEEQSIPKPVEKKQQPLPKPAYDSVLSTTELSAEAYEKQKKEYLAKHMASEAQSIEYTQSVSAAEIKETAENLTALEEKPSVGRILLEEEAFDARKAFVYSEIFKRKYS